MRPLLAVFIAATAGSASLGAPVRAVAPASVVTAAADTNGASRDSLMNLVLAQIKGKERLPAESVFKNIKVLKGVMAANIPRIMNLGYGRALAVPCAHCHIVGEWDKEDKPEKQITRDMSAMSNTINTQLLAKIANLKSAKPVINCTTCHRGDVKPALDMPTEPAR